MHRGKIESFVPTANYPGLNSVMKVFLSIGLFVRRSYCCRCYCVGLIVVGLIA